MDDDLAASALELFDSGLYCAESVLLAMSQTASIRSEVIPRIATGLCSGMARTGGMCGAVSGAILAIGLLAGRDSAKASVEPAYSQVRSLIASFQERHGSVYCPDLIGCDLSTEEGQRVFEQKRLIERCRTYVHDATKIAQDLASAPT